MWEGIEKRDSWTAKYGMEKGSGCSFQDRGLFKPLQAADILAWQLNWHMRNVIMMGKDDVRDSHLNFTMLRIGSRDGPCILYGEPTQRLNRSPSCRWRTHRGLSVRSDDRFAPSPGHEPRLFIPRVASTKVEL